MNKDAQEDEALSLEPIFVDELDDGATYSMHTPVEGQSLEEEEGKIVGARSMADLPVRLRGLIYTIQWIIATILSGLNVGFLAATGEVPVWLGVVNAVAFAYGIGQGTLAKKNVPSSEF